MNVRHATLLAVLSAAVIGALPFSSGPSAFAAEAKPPAISADASAAVARMGAALKANEFSFQARTLRTYAGANNEQLHIGHDFKVTVRRPDRLLVDIAGDDGARKVTYDGKTFALVLDGGAKYVSLLVPNTITGMMEVAVGRFGVDFPLADFISDDPGKAFLSGVTGGREVNTVTIDGVECRHLVFSQPPGIEIELWLEKNDRSLPRRLVVSYPTLPKQPNFVAELSDWTFDVHSPDADFVFQPKADAERVDIRAVMAAQSSGGRP